MNVVPDDVRMELFVRGRTLDAIVDPAAKVDRALLGGAAMVGAEAAITNQPRYLPLLPDRTLTAAFRENAAALLGADGVNLGEGFRIVDPEMACLVPAKAKALVDLLADGAALGRGVLETFRPRMTRAQYPRSLRTGEAPGA